MTPIMRGKPAKLVFAPMVSIITPRFYCTVRAQPIYEAQHFGGKVGPIDECQSYVSLILLELRNRLSPINKAGFAQSPQKQIGITQKSQSHRLRSS
jgi:hypothetical protein